MCKYEQGWENYFNIIPVQLQITLKRCSYLIQVSQNESNQDLPLDYFKYVNKLNRKASEESFKLQADMRQIGYSLQGAARIKQKYLFLIR